MLFTTPRHWKPRWKYRARGYLWSMHFSGAGRIIIEERNPDTKETSFSCLEESTGTPVWRDMSFDEPWWIGIEDVTQRYIYFHRYRQPDMPQRLGVTACAVETGRVLWERPECAFAFALEDELVVSREDFEQAVFLVLDAAAGEVKSTLNPSDPELVSRKAGLDERDRFAGFLYPDAYASPEQMPAERRDLLHRFAPQETVVGNVDILSHRGRLFLAWHEVMEPQLQGTGIPKTKNEGSVAGEVGSWRIRQRMAGIDADGKVILDLVLLDETSAPAPDSFFVKDEQLLVLQGRTTLLSFDTER